MGKVTRDRLGSLNDELVTYEREHHGDPYMALAQAKEMRRTALKFWHLGALHGHRRGQRLKGVGGNG